VTTRVFADGELVSETENPHDAVWLDRQRNRAQIIADLTDGLEANRQMADQDQAIIDAAQAIESYAGSTLTQAQTIAALKQLALGVRVLAQHDRVALVQRNYLARLALSAFDGTD
jgi:hypothetical protein